MDDAERRLDSSSCRPNGQTERTYSLLSPLLTCLLTVFTCLSLLRKGVLTSWFAQGGGLHSYRISRAPLWEGEKFLWTRARSPCRMVAEDGPNNFSLACMDLRY
jgi:hypothetical protein